MNSDTYPNAKKISFFFLNFRVNLSLSLTNYISKEITMTTEQRERRMRDLNRENMISTIGIKKKGI